MAQLCSAADVRIGVAEAFGATDKEQITRGVLAELRKMPGRTGKRVITGAEWARELGQKNSDIAAEVESKLQAVREMQVTMTHASLNDGDRTIDLDVATDTPVRRRDYNFFDSEDSVYDEILDMSPGAVRLERLNKGAPLLDSHNYSGGTLAMIGAIVPGSARIRAGRLTARAKFSRSENGERVFQDAKDGILRSVSVGYMIHKMEIDDDAEPPIHRIIDWEPHEVSVVAIPADRNAGFRESQVALAS
jgi:Caudovirus prohead serine protease